MSPKAEMDIMNLCKGKTIAQVERRLSIMQAYIDQKTLEKRVKLCGIKIGD